MHPGGQCSSSYTESLCTPTMSTTPAPPTAGVKEVRGLRPQNPPTAVLLIITRPSISQYVSPSCGPVSCKHTPLSSAGDWEGGVMSFFFSYLFIFFFTGTTTKQNAPVAFCAGFFCTHLLHKSALWETLRRECSAAHFLILNYSEMQQY